MIKMEKSQGTLCTDPSLVAPVKAAALAELTCEDATEATLAGVARVVDDAPLTVDTTPACVDLAVVCEHP